MVIGTVVRLCSFVLSMEFSAFLGIEMQPVWYRLADFSSPPLHNRTTVDGVMVSAFVIWDLD